MCWLEVQEGKNHMKKHIFKQLGATASCVLCVVTAGKSIKTYHDYPPLTHKDEESGDEESIGQSSEDHIIIDKNRDNDDEYDGPPLLIKLPSNVATPERATTTNIPKVFVEASFNISF